MALSTFLIIFLRGNSKSRVSHHILVLYLVLIVIIFLRDYNAQKTRAFGLCRGLEFGLGERRAHS